LPADTGDKHVKHGLLTRLSIAAIALSACAAWAAAQDAAHRQEAATHGEAVDSHAADTAGDAAAAEGAEAAGGHGAGEPAPSSPFAGGLGNSLLTLLIFGTVVVILGKKAWPPLLKALDEREHSIRGALEQAKKEREEADALLAKYREQIDKAREEATEIVEEGRRDAEVVRRRLQDEARQEATEMVDRAKREIQLATDGAIKTLYDQTAELAVDVAGRIIKKELSAADHNDLVSQSLERMKGQAKLN
jgi:F-type H+-transporting ATPase subunit b